MISKKCVLIIQARTGSTRFPKKVLAKINGITLIEQIINRVKKVKRIDEIVLATTKKKEDNILCRLAKKNKISFFRGSENDLVDRYYKAAIHFDAKFILRLPADNPIPEPKEYDRLIKYHLTSKNDFSSNLCNFKKNGYLIIGTPDFDSAMARRYKNRYRLLHDKTHISLFSLDSISRLLRDSSFKIKLIDFPYFETKYFNKKNLFRLFSTKKVSPPFYGSFMTILSKMNN